MPAPHAWAGPRGWRRGSLLWRGKVFGGVEEYEERLGRAPDSGGKRGRGSGATESSQTNPSGFGAEGVWGWKLGLGLG